MHKENSKAQSKQKEKKDTRAIFHTYLNQNLSATYTNRLIQHTIQKETYSSYKDVYA